MTVNVRVLSSTDDRASFSSGDEALDLFFHRYAGQNQFRHHVGVTYVLEEGAAIVGFVSVTVGTVDADDLPSGRKRPPYPLPVLRIARLAVGRGCRGRGFGRTLLRFCVELAETVRDEVGCVGLVVDAKPGASTFYEQYGFEAVRSHQGQSNEKPAPQAMFLALGAVPAGRDKQIHRR